MSIRFEAPKFYDASTVLEEMEARRRERKILDRTPAPPTLPDPPENKDSFPSIPGLTSRQGIYMQLYYSSGLTYTEIGDLRDVTNSSVSQTLKKARENLGIPDDWTREQITEHVQKILEEQEKQTS